MQDMTMQYLKSYVKHIIRGGTNEFGDGLLQMPKNSDYVVSCLWEGDEMIDVRALWFGLWFYAILVSVWDWHKYRFDPWLEKKVMKNRRSSDEELLGGDWHTTDGELIIKDGIALKEIRKGTPLWISLGKK